MVAIRELAFALLLLETNALLPPVSHERKIVCRRLAPSGVDGLPLAEQAITFGEIYLSLGVGTAITTKALSKPPPLSPYILGLLYIIAGIAHFAVPGAFESIVPPIGTWGLFYIPGSPQFHVAWSGIAEIAGGLGLILPVKDLRPLAAKCLFLLTLAVTPANIYMYTHGALMVGAGPDIPLDLSFHYIRFVFQVALLSILATMALSSSDDN